MLNSLIRLKSRLFTTYDHMKINIEYVVLFSVNITRSVGPSIDRISEVLFVFDLQSCNIAQRVFNYWVGDVVTLNYQW
jgi:hypothetical protein